MEPKLLQAEPAKTPTKSIQIKGYSLAKGMGIGKYTVSDSFMAGGYSWAIYFYPDGMSVKDNAAYVSLYIALASEGTDVKALFELSLLDQSGKGRHKVHSHFGRAMKRGPFMLKHRGCMWGYKRFFRRAKLEALDYLKDDTLSINCTVRVGPEIYSIDVPPSNIGQHFGHLLESGKRTDVKFEVDGETFVAHKLVLAARSPVFRAQLFGPMRDQSLDCIHVDDMEAAVFKAMLHYIYWDSLPDMEEITCLNSKLASIMMSQHLLAAADRYGLERLKVLCEAKLCENVGINTVATTLALGEHHHCTQLKSVCMKFVTRPENLRAVMQIDGYDYLVQSCPSVLTELQDYFARFKEHSISAQRRDNESFLLDGSDANGRRAKQRPEKKRQMEEDGRLQLLNLK